MSIEDAARAGGLLFLWGLCTRIKDARGHLRLAGDAAAERAPTAEDLEEMRAAEARAPWTLRHVAEEIRT
jgi:hypothetical protein